MSNVVKVTRSKINALAEAFRTKLGTSDQLTLQEMLADIDDLASKPELGDNWLIVDFVNFPGEVKRHTPIAGEGTVVRRINVLRQGDTWKNADRVDVLDGGNCWRGYFGYGSMSHTLNDNKVITGFEVGWYNTKGYSFREYIQFYPASVENGLLLPDGSGKHTTPVYIKMNCNTGIVSGVY